METTYLGRTGLKVSRLCLGTMNFGPYTTEEDSYAIMDRALELGINFFDTADMYSLGVSEELTGKMLRKFGVKRENVVVTTKLFFNLTDEINAGGLSRKHIMDAIDASLTRLGMDYVDLYQIHRWDYETPIEETMEALHDIVKAGKARYIGASSMYAWQFAKAQHTAEVNGWTRFTSMQNHYNLVYREEEREMNPYCANTGVALTPWSPLARGILTGSYKGSLDGGSTARSQGADRKRTEGLYRGEMDFQIADRVIEVAEKLGHTPAQIAVAWLLSKPEITAPVVGVSKVSQLEQLVAATEIRLAEDDITYLEELYKPVENLLSFGSS